MIRLSVLTIALTAVAGVAAAAMPVVVSGAPTHGPPAPPAATCTADAAGDIECLVRLASASATPMETRRIVIRTQYEAAACAAPKSGVVEMPGALLRRSALPRVDHGASTDGCAG